MDTLAVGKPKGPFKAFNPKGLPKPAPMSLPGTKESREAAYQATATELYGPPARPQDKGFNYGTGWTGAFPPLYYTANVVADTLREDMARTSKRSWDMDMALRAMRLAETQAEFDRATARVQAEMDKVLGQGYSPLGPKAANDNH